MRVDIKADADGVDVQANTNGVVDGKADAEWSRYQGRCKKEETLAAWKGRSQLIVATLILLGGRMLQWVEKKRGGLLPLPQGKKRGRGGQGESSMLSSRGDKQTKCHSHGPN